ncbi:MAG: hypothetical protein ACRCSK_03225 [Fusobacteriaceae bacterium]
MEEKNLARIFSRAENNLRANNFGEGKISYKAKNTHRVFFVKKLKRDLGK